MKKETMTSRQRVIEAINHRTPDRMPIDLGMHSSTRISAFAYWNLREHLGLPVNRVEIADGVQVTARVDEDILKRFHCDCVILKPPLDKSQIWNPRGKYNFTVPDYYNPKQNSQGEWIVKRGTERMKMPNRGFFFDGNWLAMEDVWDENYMKMAAREAERIYKETDYFTVFLGFYPLYNADINYFCDMITDPERLMEENEVALSHQLELATYLIKNMKGHIGGICMSGDLGSQHSPMVNPEVFEHVSAPYLKRFCDFVHRNSDYKIFLHCCGSIEPLIPALIDCGVDILNPVQVSAQNMEPEMLKAKYGKDMVFWGGGVDTQNVLGFKSPDAVSENVKYLTDTFKPGGGYVFAAVHNIMGNVSPESIIAAYDTAYENSWY